MNVATRGSKQNVTIAFRVTSEDKTMIEDYCLKNGTNASSLIKRLLIAHQIISPSYTKMEDF